MPSPTSLADAAQGRRRSMWDVLYRVDESFNVIGAVKTFF
jgi:hypothetical protein